MPRRLTLVPLLLAAALFAGPVLASAHDADHGLQPGAAHACVVCAYAHGAGHGALPVTPGLVLAAPGEAPHAGPTAAQGTVAVRLHPIRGPPALLA
jgi:hypothetical protein